MNLPSHELRKTLSVKPLLDMYMNQQIIMEFDDELITKIKSTNVFMLINFYQVFEEGINIGTCGNTSKYLSFLFDDFTLILDGKCEILKGTSNSPDGKHAWLLIDGYVYDTTLMLKIREDVAYSALGYVPDKQITSKELMKDWKYVIQKEFSQDVEGVKWKTNFSNELEKFKLRCL